MDPIRNKKEETIRRFKELTNLQDEEFRQKLIELTKQTLIDESKFDELLIDEMPITKHQIYTSKKELAVDFSKELLNETKGRVKIQFADSEIIPSKLLLALKKLSKLQKESLTVLEIEGLLNTYRQLFEIVVRILDPHFKTIIEDRNARIFGNRIRRIFSSPIKIKSHLDWSDIEKEINKIDKKYSKLFECMNGNLRNAAAHEASFISKNKLSWLTEDHKEIDYPIEKVFNKIYDTISLILVLYAAFSQTHIAYLIKFYEMAPIQKLKTAFEQVPFP